MLQKTNPIETIAWGKLEAHYQVMKDRHMKDLFKEDLKRFEKLSLKFEDILVDFSKNIITNKTIEFFIELAEEIQLKDAINKMFIISDLI